MLLPALGEGDEDHGEEEDEDEEAGHSEDEADDKGWSIRLSGGNANKDISLGCVGFIRIYHVCSLCQLTKHRI